MKERKVRKSRKIGGTLYLPLTGLIEEDTYYSVESENGTLILKKLKLLEDVGDDNKDDIETSE